MSSGAVQSPLAPLSKREDVAQAARTRGPRTCRCDRSPEAQNLCLFPSSGTGATARLVAELYRVYAHGHSAKEYAIQIRFYKTVMAHGVHGLDYVGVDATALGGTTGSITDVTELLAHSNRSLSTGRISCNGHETTTLVSTCHEIPFLLS